MYLLFIPLLWASLVAQLVKNPCAMQETPVRFLGWEDLLEEGHRLPTLVLLGFPGGLDGIKNLPAVRETWVSSLGWKDPLEEGMTTHSSILAWRILTNRGAWWCSYDTVHRMSYIPWCRKESDVTERLTTAQHLCCIFIKYLGLFMLKH